MGAKSTHSHNKDGSGQSFFSSQGGKLIEFARTVYETGSGSADGSTFEVPGGVTGGTIFQYNGKTIHAFTASGTFTIGPSQTLVDKNCEMILIGGGGGSPWASGSASTGGGGAGGMVLFPSITLSNGLYTVVIGAGGNGHDAPRTSPAPATYGGDLASKGNHTTFGPGAIGAAGGGSAYSYSVIGPAPVNKALFIDGGCGGGGGGTASPAPEGQGFAVNDFSNPGGTEYGHPAGLPASRGTAGGGGIGGAGKNANPGFPSVAGVNGGLGLQLPATFRDPSNVYGVPGPGGTAHWIGGGGASGSWDTATWGSGGAGPSGSGGPFAGGGNGGSPSSPAGVPGQHGTANTGGGAGGAYYSPSYYNNLDGTNGGSGLLMIAYPT